MSRGTRFLNLKERISGLTPGEIRRKLRVEASRLGQSPARPFADISGNNAISAAQLREYAKNHEVIAIKVSEGATWRDPTAPMLVKVAKEEGLLVMPYHFARPDNNRPEAEVKNFIGACRAAGLRMGPRRRFWFQRDELPGVLDYEVADPADQDALWIDRFMNAYQHATKHGRTSWRDHSKDKATAGPIIYGGSVVREKLAHVREIHAIYWLAAYTKSPSPYWPTALPHRYRAMWQFTDKGKFDAFPKPTDRSKFMGGVKLRDIIRIAT